MAALPINNKYGILYTLNHFFLAKMIVTFDTHEFIRTLTAAGMPDEQAEAVSNAFKNAQTELDVATKKDLYTALNELELRLVKWGIGLALGQVAVIAALVKLL